VGKKWKKLNMTSQSNIMFSLYQGHGDDSMI
jgi:hypothetical protein